ncbi:hypothetical protein BC830DRAFT_1078905 [Chytriomyces sp. MP71]|nr:hypothetical protein BC830DRAFT_1078905 [Chytriomyces sp. MP71]
MAREVQRCPLPSRVFFEETLSVSCGQSYSRSGDDDEMTTMMHASDLLMRQMMTSEDECCQEYFSLTWGRGRKRSACRFALQGRLLEATATGLQSNLSTKSQIDSMLSDSRPERTSSRSPSPTLSEATTLSTGSFAVSAQPTMSLMPSLVAYPTARAIAHPDRSFADLDGLVSDIVKRILYVNEGGDKTAHLPPASHGGRKTRTNSLVPGPHSPHSPGAARSRATHAHVTVNVASAVRPDVAPVARSLKVIGGRVDTTTRIGDVKSRIEFRAVRPLPLGLAPEQQHQAALYSGSDSDSSAAAAFSKRGRSVAAAAPTTSGGTPEIKSAKFSQSLSFISPTATSPLPLQSSSLSSSSASPASKPNLASKASTLQLKTPADESLPASPLPSLQEYLGPVMGKDDEPTLAEEMAMLLLEVCQESGTSAMMSITVRSFLNPVEATNGRAPANSRASGSPLSSVNGPCTAAVESGASTPVLGVEGPLDVAELSEQLSKVSVTTSAVGGVCGARELCSTGVHALCEVWGTSYQIGPVEECQCGPHLAEGFRLYKMNREVVMASSVVEYEVNQEGRRYPAYPPLLGAFSGNFFAKDAVLALESDPHIHDESHLQEKP